mmetsp:Transcript_27247/g.70164  ORF Transcript_27247/g.70164 Transcript_27247/m.70164 type:complete len:248 (-) Transcript_27247:455-1198(-)
MQGDALPLFPKGRRQMCQQLFQEVQSANFLQEMVQVCQLNFLFFASSCVLLSFLGDRPASHVGSLFLPFLFLVWVSCLAFDSLSCVLPQKRSQEGEILALKRQMTHTEEQKDREPRTVAPPKQRASSCTFAFVCISACVWSCLGKAFFSSRSAPTDPTTLPFASFPGMRFPCRGRRNELVQTKTKTKPPREPLGTGRPATQTPPRLRGGPGLFLVHTPIDLESESPCVEIREILLWPDDEVPLEDDD